MEMVLKLVNNTPYTWWNPDEGTMDNEAPFYCQRIPDILTIQKYGTNCAGLVNLLQLSRGLIVPGVKTNNYYAGGTYIWYQYLSSLGVLEPIDTSKEYPMGSLLLRRYTNPEDQGHLAILYTGGRLLQQKLVHCYPEAGIKINSFKESHSWIKNGYYEFICVDWFHRDISEPDF